MTIERWGIEWKPGDIYACKQMPDGYWTPWHIAADTITTLRAENEKLREALDISWVAATKMRNAAKLVGPYPNDAKLNRVWARSLYHQGKELMTALKPIRAALKGGDHD